MSRYLIAYLLSPSLCLPLPPFASLNYYVTICIHKTHTNNVNTYIIIISLSLSSYTYTSKYMYPQKKLYHQTNNHKRKVVPLKVRRLSINTQNQYVLTYTFFMHKKSQSTGKCRPEIAYFLVTSESEPISIIDYISVSIPVVFHMFD